MLQVGDCVRIKSWERMEKEFGTVGDPEAINCTCYFLQEMKPFCGLIGKVERLSPLLFRDESVFRVYFTHHNPILKDAMQEWKFSTDMVVKIKPVEGWED